MRAVLATSLLVFVMLFAAGWFGQQQNRNITLPAVAMVRREGVPETKQATPSTEEEITFPDLEAILSRPLFVPDRRPIDLTPAPAIETPPEPVAKTQPTPRAPEPVAAPPPNFQLHGLIQVEDVWRALVSVDGGAANWLTKKQLLNGWVLSDITTEAVIFEREDKRMSVALHP